MVYAYVPNFVSIGLLCCPLAAKKTQILPFWGIRHFVVSPIGGNLRKLNMGAQLQTFPYPTVSKSFPYSKAFIAKSGAQTLSVHHAFERQAKKLNVFGLDGGG